MRFSVSDNFTSASFAVSGLFSELASSSRIDASSRPFSISAVAAISALSAACVLRRLCASEAFSHKAGSAAAFSISLNFLLFASRSKITPDFDQFILKPFQSFLNLVKHSTLRKIMIIIFYTEDETNQVVYGHFSFLKTTRNILTATSFSS